MGILSLIITNPDWHLSCFKADRDHKLQIVDFSGDGPVVCSPQKSSWYGSNNPYECRLLHGYDLDFSPNEWRWKFGPALNLLLFLLLLLVILFLFLVLLLGGLLSRGLLLTLRSLRIPM